MTAEICVIDRCGTIMEVLNRVERLGLAMNIEPYGGMWVVTISHPDGSKMSVVEESSLAEAMSLTVDKLRIYRRPPLRRPTVEV